MKTVNVPEHGTDASALLEEARDDDVLVRAADGAEFLITAVDDFSVEVARTRQNARLMALLDERARQTKTVPLDQVREQLGLAGE